MDEKDGRSLTREQLHERRRKAIHLYSKKKKTQAAIGEELGIGRDVIGKWIKVWKKGGMRALKPRGKGRPVVNTKLLNTHEIKELKSSLIDFEPNKFGEGFQLWNWSTLQDFIERVYSTRLARRTLVDYLHSFGIRFRKPLDVYKGGNEALDSWVRDSFPQVQEKVSNEKAKMLWLIKTDFFPNPGNIHAKTKYQTVAVVCNRGSNMFQIEERNRMSNQNFRYFLSIILKQFDQKIFLLLEDRPEHRTYLISTWLRKQSGSIELIYYPPLKQLKSTKDTAEESKFKIIKINEKVREIGSYRVIKFLGEGRMGKVYKVQNAEGEVKAIKVIHAHVLADQDLRAKCLESLQAQYALRNNKNVISLEEIHEASEVILILMEYLFQNRLEESSERQTAWFASQTFSALNTIHKFNAQHGNLKNSNLLVDAKGTLKVGDFWVDRDDSLFHFQRDAYMVSFNEVQKAKSFFAPYLLRYHKEGEEDHYWTEFLEGREYESPKKSPAYQAFEFLKFYLNEASSD